MERQRRTTPRLVASRPTTSLSTLAFRDPSAEANRCFLKLRGMRQGRRPMISEWIGTITLILFLCLSTWWCLRQYYLARRKGYSPALAATVVLGGAFITVAAGIVLLDSFWYGRETMVTLLIFPVPALVVTVLVALLPRRPRRAGERRSSFLSSPACRVLEAGLLVVARAAIVPVIFSLVALSGYVIGIWPKSELADNLSDVRWGILILGFGAATLRFARERLGAPGLAEAVAADTRPAVLYLRAFRQESDPFAWVIPKEHSRYTRRQPVINRTIVTFEQYLGAEFARQLGPFIALGNPFDSVPPEGAARSYAPDEDWQRHFCALAGAAAAIVMDGSRSNNLRWELTEITRNGWQHKLFLLTSPAAQLRDAFIRIVNAVWRLAKGVRIPRWEQFAAELKDAGLYVPPIEPDLGSVVAFDAAGRAEVLIRCAQRPEEFVTAVRTRLGRQRGDDGLLRPGTLSHRDAEYPPQTCLPPSSQTP
jgi:hypothetical protein